MRLYILIALGSGILCAQPTITTPALNDAGSAPYGLPNSGVAQGARFYILGNGIGPAQAATSRSGERELGGVSVKVTVASASVDALLTLARAREIIAILPADAPLGEGQVTVTFDGQTSRPAPITVVRRAFGLYTLNAFGNGPADALALAGGKESEITIFKPAAAGSEISIIGTGLGAGDPSIRVLIGGESLTPVEVFRGRNGLDEIVFALPAGTQGCYVPVAVSVEGQVSNYGTIAADIGDGTCGETYGLPAEALKKAGEGSDLAIGALTLSRFFSGDIFDDGINGSFSLLTAEDVLTSWGPLSAPSAGSCMVVYTEETTLPVDPIDPELLRAGQIAIRGPKRTTTVNPRQGFYSATIGDDTNSFIEKGDYTISNSQGAQDVAGFEAKLTIADSFQWVNRADVGPKINRASDLTFKWSGVGPEDDVIVYGGGATDLGGAVFVCTRKAAAGELTVPAQVLSSIPALGAYTSTRDGDFGGAIWVVRSTPLTRNTFQARGIDVGLLSFQEIFAKAVSFE